MADIICRHDDFDFRLLPSQYIAIHEEFIKRNLVETAVLQFTHDNRLSNFDPALIKYMREAPNWDFQLHGWAHAEYDAMDYDHIVRDLAAASHFCYRFFNKVPTVWYPPWNRCSITMEKAAETMDLKISNESYDIARFVREAKVGQYKGSTLYFHGWKSDEMLCFQEMLQLLKEVNSHAETTSI